MAELTSLSSLCGDLKSNLETTRQLLSEWKSSMANSYRDIEQCLAKSAQEMKQSCARILELLQEEIDASESLEIVASESLDVDASELSADKMMATMTDDLDSLQDARKSEAVSAIHRHYKPQIHPSLRPPAKPSYCSQHIVAVAWRRHSIPASIPRIIPPQSKVTVRLFSVCFAECLCSMKFRNIIKVIPNGVCQNWFPQSSYVHQHNVLNVTTTVSIYAQLNLSCGAQKLFDTLPLRNNAIWSHTVIRSSISLGAIPIDMLCAIVLQENVVLVNPKQVYAIVCSVSAYVQVLILEWFSKIDEEETTHQVVDDMPRMIMLCLKSLFLGYITVGIFTALLMYGTKRPIVLAFFVNQLVNFVDIEKLLSDNSSRKIVGSYVIVTVMLGFWPMPSPPLSPKPPEPYQAHFPNHLNGFYQEDEYLWFYHVNLNMELLNMLAIAGNGVKLLTCQFSSKMSMYLSYSVHQRRLTVLQSSIEYDGKRAVWVPTQQTMVARKVWTACSWYGYHLGLLPKPMDQSTVMIIWNSSNSVGCLHFMEVRDSFAATLNIVCQIMLPSSIKVHCHDIANHSITISYVQYVLVSLNFAIKLTLSCTGFTIIFLASTWHDRVDEFGWPLIWIEQQMMTNTILVQFLNHVQQVEVERFPWHLKMHMVPLEVGNYWYGLYHQLLLGGVYILKSSFAIHDELAGVLIHGEMKLAKLLNSKLVRNILHLLTHIATMTQSGCLLFSISNETQFFGYAPRDTQPSTTFDMFNSLLMEWLFNPSSTKDFVVAFVPISFAPDLENTLSITMLKFNFYVQTFIVVVTIAVGAIKNSVDAYKLV